jgi:FMN-dependent NADH-azoreductase
MILVFQKSYYKPTEKEVLDDYLKAVDLLTINRTDMLHKQVPHLSKKVEKKIQKCRELKGDTD